VQGQLEVAAVVAGGLEGDQDVVGCSEQSEQRAKPAASSEKAVGLTSTLPASPTIATT
jgi:hypothetical protein